MVEAVLLSGGSIGTAQQVASHLGFHNRFELARFLKREGLPPLHDLAAWASVLTWVDRNEHTGCSLCQLAFGARRDPAVCYRTVKRITGLQWHDLKHKGLAWVVERFIARCHANADRYRAPPSNPSLLRAARNHVSTGSLHDSLQREPSGENLVG